MVLASDAAVSFPLASALRRHGWAVVSARDSAQAMQVARQQKPDAIVVDAGLAGGGGVAALQRLRSSILTAAIPAICVAPPASRAREEFAAAGASEIIDAPGDPEAVASAIDRALNRREPMMVPLASLSSPPRTAALKESALLDSPEDERIDRLTRLTASLLGVPVALVSVVDADRQFFKSQTGLPEPWRSRRQTPLSHSFCQWVVAGDEEVVVGDALSHPVLQSNLAIRDLNVLAYAGVPFRARPGEPLGSFCAIDHRRREWQANELAVLRDLSLILEAYLAPDEETAAPRAVASGILGATRTLLRDDIRPAPADRSVLAAITEELSRRLLRLHGT